MHGRLQRFSKRMGEGRSPETALPGETLTRAELITTVRRLGYICLKVHEVVMGRLTSQDQYEMAERFNDLFKPLADMLVGFELDDTLERDKPSGEEEGHGV